MNVGSQRKGVDAKVKGMRDTLVVPRSTLIRLSQLAFITLSSTCSSLFTYRSNSPHDFATIRCSSRSSHFRESQGHSTAQHVCQRLPIGYKCSREIVVWATTSTAISRETEIWKESRVRLPPIAVDILQQLESDLTR